MCVLWIQKPCQSAGKAVAMQRGPRIAVAGSRRRGKWSDDVRKRVVEYSTLEYTALYYTLPTT